MMLNIKREVSQNKKKSNQIKKLWEKVMRWLKRLQDEPMSNLQSIYHKYNYV